MVWLLTLQVLHHLKKVDFDAIVDHLALTYTMPQKSYQSRQIYIYKIFEIMQRKVLKGTHLQLTVKEIQAGY